MEEPTLNAETVPDVFIVATEVSLLSQEPPEVASARVEVDPEQTVVVPVIAEGADGTVITVNKVVT